MNSSSGGVLRGFGWLFPVAMLCAACSPSGFDPCRDAPRPKPSVQQTRVENRSFLTLCLSGGSKSALSPDDIDLVLGGQDSDLRQDLTCNGVPDELDALVCAELLGKQALGQDSWIDKLIASDISAETSQKVYFLKGLFSWVEFIGRYRTNGCSDLQSPVLVDWSYLSYMEDSTDALRLLQDLSSFSYVPSRIPSWSICDLEVELNQEYDISHVRDLGAVLNAHWAFFSFMFAHLDLNQLLSSLTRIASQPYFHRSILTTAESLGFFNAMRPLVLDFLARPISSEEGQASLNRLRQAVIDLSGWISRGALASIPPHVSGRKIHPGTPLTWDDKNANGMVDACDEIHSVGPPVNLMGTSDLFGGCEESASADVIVLPATFLGRPISYPQIWSALAEVLKVIADDLAQPGSRVVGSTALNPLLEGLGLSPMSDLIRIVPHVLFEKGLSVFIPSQNPDGTLTIEAEINENMPAEADTRIDFEPPVGELTEEDPSLYRTKSQDWSRFITRGDGPHFDGTLPADNISVSESGLDLDGAAPDNSFRVKQGGGFLPYIKFEDPALGGLIRIRPEMLQEITDEVTPLCDRDLSGITPGESVFQPTDDFSLNAMLGYLILKLRVCSDFRKLVACPPGTENAGQVVERRLRPILQRAARPNPAGSIPCDPAAPLWPLADGNRWHLASNNAWDSPFGSIQAFLGLEYKSRLPVEGEPGEWAVNLYPPPRLGIPEACCPKWFFSNRPFGVLMNGTSYYMANNVFEKPTIWFVHPQASKAVRECAALELVASDESIQTDAGTYTGVFHYALPGPEPRRVDYWLCSGVGPVQVEVRESETDDPILGIIPNAAPFILDELLLK